MRKIATLVGLAALTASLSGCWARGWGDDDAGAVQGTVVSSDNGQSTRSYAVKDFTGIVVAGPDNVVVRQGAQFSVTATGPNDALDKLIIRVRDNKLEVRRRRGESIFSGHGARIMVTLPTSSSVVVAGSGSIDIDHLTGDDAEVVIAGSGDARVAQVESPSLKLTVAGSGEARAAGTARRVEVSIAGSGDVIAPELRAESADISIAGSGDVRMAVTGEASVSTVGSGDVTLTGGAHCTTSKMGSGTVNCS